MGEKFENFISMFSLLLMKELVNIFDPKLGYGTLSKISKKFAFSILQLAGGKIELEEILRNVKDEPFSEENLRLLPPIHSLSR